MFSVVVGNQVDAFSLQLADQIKHGDLSMLLVGHAMSCGLKVLTSEMACGGIETCRRVRSYSSKRTYSVWNSDMYAVIF